MPDKKPNSAARAAFGASLTYWAISAVWILLSDGVVPWFTKDPSTIRRISMLKGWGFVTVSAALLYGVIRRQLSARDRELARRRESEKALRESESRFRIMIEQSPDALFVHDLQGRIVDANRGAWESLGYSREELLKLKLADVEQDLDSPELRGACGQIQPGETRTFNGNQRRKDGSILPVEVRVSCCDAGGQRLILALARDLTERRRAEAIMEHRLELQERLSRMAATVPGMIYAFRMQTDGAFSFPYVGEAAWDILGIPAEQLVASAETGFRMMHPRDVRWVKKSIMQSALRLTPWRVEFRVRHPEKGDIWIEGRSAPRREADGSTLWYGFLHDITERKRAEELQARLATAVEQAAEAIVITDPAGVILYVNPAFEKVTGYTPDEALGRNPRMLKSGRHEDAFYRRMWDGLKADGVWSGHMVNKRKNGTVYEEEMTISTVLDAAGNIANYVAVKRDVTREVELEQQLRQAQKMEAIGQLAGGVAHDFNNILTVIQGNASMLAEAGVQGEEIAECSNQILIASERAANLTRQLLVFSRKQIMQPVSLDLNEVLAGTTKMLRRIVGEDIALHTEFAPEVPRILADAGMIEQIVLNLAVNSRDAMPEGGRLVIATSTETVDEGQVAQTPGASGGRCVRLTVTDSGSGIPPEVMPRIFEPFFTTKEVGRGTGLGLATVHGIVKQHHGWIEVQSEAGKGTSFHIRFPALEGALLAEKGNAIAGELPRGTETILIAEDEPSLRELVCNLLRRCGYTVLAAESGVVALRIWRENKDQIRLLLTDLVMPGGVTGFNLAEQICAEKPRVQVIYTSGYSTEVRKAVRLKDGVKFLQKPYSPSVLAQLVRTCLDQK